MKKIGMTSLAIAAGLMLAACGDNKQATQQTTNETSLKKPEQDENVRIPVQKAANNEELYNLALQRKGFVVGGEGKSQLSNPEIIVFFDPQCIHCGTYWETTRILEKDLKMKWIPVAILNKDSMISGSHILASDNPSKTFTEHKNFVDQGVRGIPNTPVSEFEREILANSDFFVLNEARGIPFSILRRPDGTYSREDGVIPVDILMGIFNIENVNLETTDNSNAQPATEVETSTTETPTPVTEEASVVTPESAVEVSTTETPTSVAEEASVVTPESAVEVSTTETPTSVTETSTEVTPTDEASK